MKININGLSLRYSDVDALLEATLWDISSGEIHALVGPNGSGKTSLLRCLSGTFEPYANISGSISIDGENVIDFWDVDLAHKQGIFMVPQDPALVEGLTVLQNIVLGNESEKAFFRWDKEHDQSLVNDTMNNCGLVVPLDATAGTLSASAKQKTAILQVLHRTKGKKPINFILFDEPTTHLTDTEVLSLFAFLNECRNEKNIGIIIVSHNVNDIKKYADKITLFNRGCINCTYSADEFLNSITLFSKVAEHKIEVLQRTNANAALLHCDSKVTFNQSVYDIAFNVSSGGVVIISGAEELLDDFFRFLVGLPQHNQWDGELTFNDKSIADLPLVARRKLGIGLMSSDKSSYGIFGDLSVYENLAMRIQLKSNFIYSNSCLQSTFKVLEDVKIDSDKWDKKANSLSGGNKQRLIFAREYAQSPAILVLRHPTQGLDQESRIEMSRYLNLLLNEGSGILILGGSDLNIQGGIDAQFNLNLHGAKC